MAGISSIGAFAQMGLQESWWATQACTHSMGSGKLWKCSPGPVSLDKEPPGCLCWSPQHLFQIQRNRQGRDGCTLAGYCFVCTAPPTWGPCWCSSLFCCEIWINAVKKKTSRQWHAGFFWLLFTLYMQSFKSQTGKRKGLANKTNWPPILAIFNTSVIPTSFLANGGN